MRFWVLLVLACTVSCVDSGTGPQPKRVDPGYVGKHLLVAEPALPSRVDATIGGKVVYLGNTLGSTRLAPGQAIKVSHYWKVLAPPGGNYRVFMLVHGAPNTADFMSLPITEMQRAHGPATWRANEIIEDEHEIVLRPDWRSNEATIYVGLIEIGQHGTLDRMPATGPNTFDNAVIAAKLDVDLSKAPPPPGTIYIPHAKDTITVDGVASEPGWAAAAQSPDFVTAEGSPDPLGKTVARMTWDAQYLYIHANITDTDILSQYTNQDDPLWKADALEIFIDADGNRRGYVELQVNPNNATFDSWFATTRAQPGDESWDSGMITAVRANGSGATGDTDQSWEVEIAIPWAAVKGRDEAMQTTIPPNVGDRWRVNIVRADYRTATKNASASSWNRITYQEWHALDRMLTVVFADTLGGVVPKSAPDPRAKPPVDPGAGSSAAAAPDTKQSPAESNAGSAVPPMPKAILPAPPQPSPTPPTQKPAVTPSNTAPSTAAPQAATPPTAPAVTPQAPQAATPPTGPAVTPQAPAPTDKPTLP
ncbi:MAG: sugar-binding protein [Kofleriaceae bacterium]